MKNFFKLYNGIDEYYDINRRLNMPWWSNAYLCFAKIIFKSAGKVFLNHIPQKLTLIDMHVHTKYSYCSFSDIRKLIIKANDINLDGICIMDHHTIEGYKRALDVLDELKSKDLVSKNFLLVPGIEISSKEGHIGALFCTEDIKFKEYSANDTIKMIKDMGGISTAVHPCHTSGLGEVTFRAEMDAIEVFSGSILREETYRDNLYVSNLEKFENTAKIAGSDSHFLETVGMCVTAFPEKCLNIDDVKKQITEQKTIPFDTYFYSKLRANLKIFYR